MSPSDYDVDALSGFHAPHMLVVVDEAGSLSPVLGQSLLSALSGEDGRVLVIGNPSFDDDASPWMEDRTEQWPTIRIPADATPNFTDEATPLCRVHPDQLPHPISDHLVTREWVSEVIATEGQASAYYTARVRAEFPRDAGGRAIPRSWLGSAVQSGPVALGVDIAAGGGDHFAIVRSVGLADERRRLELRHSVGGAANADSSTVTARCLDEIAAAEALSARLDPNAEPVRVKIDAIGVGWGIVGNLRRLGDEGAHGARIVAVVVSERPETRQAQARFASKRDEMWWTMRQLLEPTTDDRSSDGDGTGLLDLSALPASTIAQLGAPRAGYTAGRHKVEDKESMRSRGVSSPDEAEAALLALYEPTPARRPATISTPIGITLPPAGTLWSGDGPYWGRLQTDPVRSVFRAREGPPRTSVDNAR